MFATHAKAYLGLGLAVIPCTGKKPAIRWGAYQSLPPDADVVDGWVKAFPQHNIGIVTGAVSGLTIIDVDNLEALPAAIGLFGDTPLKVRSARGSHLYFSFNGEKTATKINGLSVDIRAQGGFIVSPPSIHPDTGKPYAFQEGDYSLLGQLPRTKPAVIKEACRNVKNPLQIAREGERIGQGQRNGNLFLWVKNRAFSCDTIGVLMDNAQAMNNLLLTPPLPEREVTDIVQSVWRYKLRGCLMPSGTQAATITADETERLKDKPYACLLLTVLKQTHEGLRPEFNAVESHFVKKLGWTKKTVSAAMSTLVERGFLELLYRGGRYKGDKSVYRFRG